MVISVEQPPSSIKSPLPHADTVGGGVGGQGHASTWLSQRVAGGDTQSSNLTSMQHIPPSNDSSNSWEARAFAEDASSLAAGIWPPRSYPCSFCRREFRSAQALGGHMNVHRRDRARLRQLSPTGSGQTLISTAPSSNLVQADQYSTANLDLAFVYPNGSVSKFTTALPASGAGSGIIPTLSISTTSPATSIFPLNNTSVDIASSFPLRLQLLASEAASSLMQNSCPKSEPSDLLCLWPTSATINTTSGLQQSMLTATTPNSICRAICPAMTICSEAPLKLDMALTNRVNSLQLPNIVDHTSSSTYNINGDQSSLLHSVAASSNGELIPSCRRTAHEAALHVSVEDESPKKKAMYISSPELYKMTVVEPNSMQANMDLRSFNGEHEDISKRTDDQLGTAPPCGGGAGLDLELRLGHY